MKLKVVRSVRPLRKLTMEIHQTLWPKTESYELYQKNISESSCSNVQNIFWHRRSPVSRGFYKVLPPMRKYTQGKCKCTRNHPHVVKKWDKVKHSATYWDLTKWAGGFKTSFKSTKYCAWQEKCILPGPLKPTQANCGNMNEMLRLPWRDFRSENGHGTTSRELLGYSTLPAPFFALACRYSRNALRTWKSFYPATMIQWIPPDFWSFSCVVPAMQTTCEWPQAGTSSLLWLRKPLRNHTVPGKWFLVTDYNQHRLQVAPGQAMNQHGLDLNAKRILSSLSRGTCNMSLEIQRLFAIGNLRLAKSVSAFLKHGSAKLARGPMQTNPQLFQQALSVCPFTVYSVVFTCTQRHKTPSCAMKSLSICFWGPVLRWAVSESALVSAFDLCIRSTSGLSPSTNK